MNYNYVVEVTDGKVSGISRWTKTFSSTNAFEARTLALNWAKDYYTKHWKHGDVDLSFLWNGLPTAEMQNLNVLCVIVYLVDYENKENCVIHGVELEYAVSGLKKEAAYYIRKKILLPSELVTIHVYDEHNTNPKDAFKFNLKVVPTDFEFIKESLESKEVVIKLKKSNSSKSSIEWTDVTWNPCTGCDKVSAGCKYCYAEVLAKRLKAMGQEKYINGFDLTLHTSVIDLPYQWKKPKVVFVNSMSDLFHQDVPLEFIQKVFNTMNETPQHTYQVLTKRASRLEELSSQLKWSDNIWMGVSVEDMRVIDRIDHLRKTGAKIKFISAEPLIGELVNLDLSGINWVIVGGESGHNPRPMEEKWVLDIQHQCKEQGVSFFFKQWGGRNKKKTGRLLQGKEYNEMPTPESQKLINVKLENHRFK